MTTSSIDEAGRTEADSRTMRAITKSGYGGAEVLELSEIPRPEPAEGRDGPN